MSTIQNQVKTINYLEALPKNYRYKFSDCIIANSLADRKNKPVDKLVGNSKIVSNIEKMLTNPSLYAPIDSPFTVIQIGLSDISTREIPKPKNINWTQATNYGFPGKGEHNGIDWHTVYLPTALIEFMISHGYMTRLGIKNGGNDLKHFVGATGVQLDLDADSSLTWQDTLEIAKKYNLKPFMIYCSPSYEPDNNKLRIVFLFNSVVTDYDMVKRLIDGLNSIFPNAASNVGDPARFFYGSLNPIPYSDLNALYDFTELYNHVDSLGFIKDTLEPVKETEKDSTTDIKESVYDAIASHLRHITDSKLTDDDDVSTASIKLFRLLNLCLEPFFEYEITNNPNFQNIREFLGTFNAVIDDGLDTGLGYKLVGISPFRSEISSSGSSCQIIDNDSPYVIDRSPELKGVSNSYSLIQAITNWVNNNPSSDWGMVVNTLRIIEDFLEIPQDQAFKFKKQDGNYLGSNPRELTVYPSDNGKIASIVIHPENICTIFNVDDADDVRYVNGCFLRWVKTHWEVLSNEIELNQEERHGRIAQMIQKVLIEYEYYTDEGYIIKPYATQECVWSALKTLKQHLRDNNPELPDYVALYNWQDCVVYINYDQVKYISHEESKPYYLRSVLPVELLPNVPKNYSDIDRFIESIDENDRDIFRTELAITLEPYGSQKIIDEHRMLIIDDPNGGGAKGWWQEVMTLIHTRDYVSTVSLSDYMKACEPSNNGANISAIRGKRLNWGSETPDKCKPLKSEHLKADIVHDLRSFKLNHKNEFTDQFKGKHFFNSNHPLILDVVANYALRRFAVVRITKMYKKDFEFDPNDPTHLKADKKVKQDSTKLKALPTVFMWLLERWQELITEKYVPDYGYVRDYFLNLAEDLDHLKKFVSHRYVMDARGSVTNKEFWEDYRVWMIINGYLEGSVTHNNGQTIDTDLYAENPSSFPWNEIKNVCIASQQNYVHPNFPHDKHITRIQDMPTRVKKDLKGIVNASKSGDIWIYKGIRKG